MRLNNKVTNWILFGVLVIVVCFCLACESGGGGSERNTDLMEGSVPPPDIIPENILMLYTTEEGTLVEIEVIKGWIIVIFKPNSIEESVAENLIVDNGGKIISKIPNIRLYGVEVLTGGEMNFINKMRQEPTIYCVVPAIPLKEQSATVTPNEWDNYLPVARDGLSWYLMQINAPLAWGLVDESALYEREIGIIEKSYYGFNEGLQDFEGRLQNEIPPETEGGDYDEAVHGTAVSALAAAKGNNMFGNVGVNWWCKIRLIHPKTDVPIISDLVLNNLVYIYGLAEAVAQGSDVINMSFGAGNQNGNPDFGETTMKNIFDSGLFATVNSINTLFPWKNFIVVKAAGNDNCEHAIEKIIVEKPTNLVIVGASNRNKGKASYSDYGTTIDIAAPGGDSNEPEFLGWIDYSSGMDLPAYIEGTSFSAPLVAGAAALLWSVEPNLTPQQVIQRLRDTAQPFVGDVPSGKFGSGILDLYKALGGTEQLPTLKIKVIDRSNNPVSGAYVILHNADGSIEDYIITGTDGMADFGDIGRDIITVTIAYQYRAGENSYRLLSYINIPFLNDQINTVKIFKRESKIATINANTSISGGDIILGHRGIAFYFGYWGDPTGSVDIYPENLQGDGKLSMGGQYDYADEFSYGYLTDQNLIDGGNYMVNLNNTSEEISFTSNEPISDIGVTARRNEMSFSSGYEWYDPLVTSGVFQVAKQVPAEYFYVYPASLSWETGAGKYKYQKYTTLPSSLSVTMPNISVNSVSYNETTGIVSWSVSGSENKDITTVEFDFGNVSWTFWMSPLNTEWDFFNEDEGTLNLELPDEVVDWFYYADFEGIDVRIEGMDIASGFEDFIIKYLENPDLVPNEGYQASKYLDLGITSQGISTERKRRYKGLLK